jgi:hypothetical protein
MGARNGVLHPVLPAIGGRAATRSFSGEPGKVAHCAPTPADIR